MKKNSLILSNFNLIFQTLVIDLLNILIIILLYNFTGIDGSFAFGISYFIYFLINSFFKLIIPTVIENIIHEYNCFGYYKSKYKFFKYGIRIFITIGLLLFILMFISSYFLPKLLFDKFFDINLINTISDTMKIFSLSILLIPVLNFYRGYIHGNNRTSKFLFISQLLEVILVLVFALITCLIGTNIYHISSYQCVKMIALSYFASILVVFIYLIFISFKYKKILNRETLKVSGLLSSNRETVKVLFSHICFYFNIWLFHLVIYIIDVVMITRIVINKYYYLISDLKNIISFISVLGFQLISFLILLVVLFIIKKFKNIDIKNLVNNISYLLTKILLVVLPYTLIISISANLIWKIFYDDNLLLSRIFKYYIFIIPIFIIFVFLVSVLKYLNEDKKIIKIVYIGLIVKIILNLPFIYAFEKMKFPLCYGSITSTFIGYIVIIWLLLHYISKKYNIFYEECIGKILNIFAISMIMTMVLLIVSYIFPCVSDSILINISYFLFILILGLVVYYYLCKKINLIDGDKLLSKKVK